jgi:hypothetical protein
LKNKQTDRHDLQTVRLTDDQRNKWTHGQTDRHTDGCMDGLKDGQI